MGALVLFVFFESTNGDDCMTTIPNTQTLTPGRSAPRTRPLDRPSPHPERPLVATRVTADGVHLACGSTPFRVRGVTYGSFLPRADGAPFPAWERCRADLMAIAESGLNTVRTYDVPPPAMLEGAPRWGVAPAVPKCWPSRWAMRCRPTWCVSTASARSRRSSPS